MRSRLRRPNARQNVHVLRRENKRPGRILAG
jgi:hypothetical protein